MTGDAIANVAKERGARFAAPSGLQLVSGILTGYAFAILAHHVRCMAMQEDRRRCSNSLWIICRWDLNMRSKISEKVYIGLYSLCRVWSQWSLSDAWIAERSLRPKLIWTSTGCFAERKSLHFFANPKLPESKQKMVMSAGDQWSFCSATLVNLNSGLRPNFGPKLSAKVKWPISKPSTVCSHSATY